MPDFDLTSATKWIRLNQNGDPNNGSHTHLSVMSFPLSITSMSNFPLITTCSADASTFAGVRKKCEHWDFNRMRGAVVMLVYWTIIMSSFLITNNHLWMSVDRSWIVWIFLLHFASSQIQRFSEGIVSWSRSCAHTSVASASCSLTKLVWYQHFRQILWGRLLLTIKCLLADLRHVRLVQKE